MSIFSHTTWTLGAAMLLLSIVFFCAAVRLLAFVLGLKVPDRVDELMFRFLMAPVVLMFFALAFVLVQRITT